MRIIGPNVDHDVSVASAVDSYQLTSITLDSIDFYRLTKLLPDELHDWLLIWQRRFVPPHIGE